MYRTYLGDREGGPEDLIFLKLQTMTYDTSIVGVHYTYHVQYNTCALLLQSRSVLLRLRRTGRLFLFRRSSCLRLRGRGGRAEKRDDGSNTIAVFTQYRCCCCCCCALVCIITILYRPYTCAGVCVIKCSVRFRDNVIIIQSYKNPTVSFDFVRTVYKILFGIQGRPSRQLNA